MNQPDYKALCAELANHPQARVTKEDRDAPMEGYYSQGQQLIDRAHILLAQSDTDSSTGETANPWKDAVIDALVCNFLLNKENESDPKRALRDLMEWEALLARDPLINPPPQPPAGEAGELVALIRQISLAWEPDACLLGNMTAGQLTRAADLLERLAQDKDRPLKARPEFIAGYREGLADGRRVVEHEIAERLARPDIEPTDEELYILADEHGGEPVKSMRAALTRWCHPSPQPIQSLSLSERLPGPEDCNEMGQCWWFDGEIWSLDIYDHEYTHWLPVYALPLPANEVQP